MSGGVDVRIGQFLSSTYLELALLKQHPAGFPFEPAGI